MWQYKTEAPFYRASFILILNMRKAPLIGGHLHFLATDLLQSAATDSLRRSGTG